MYGIDHRILLHIIIPNTLDYTCDHLCDTSMFDLVMSEDGTTITSAFLLPTYLIFPDTRGNLAHL
jgi:hypothetical protein